MYSVQILFTLRNIISFIGIFPSDLLPHSITRSGSIIVSTDPQPEKGSRWLAIHFEYNSSIAFYFDYYGISPIIPAIKNFLRRNCTVWIYNTVQLQGLTSTVYGLYCCLSPCTWTVVTPRNISSAFHCWYRRPANKRNLHIWIRTSTQRTAWLSMQLRHRKMYGNIKKIITVNSIVGLNGGRLWLRISEGSARRDRHNGTSSSSERCPSHLPFSESVPHKSSRLRGKLTKLGWRHCFLLPVRNRSECESR